jgi:hypothetical protein
MTWVNPWEPSRNKSADASHTVAPDSIRSPYYQESPAPKSSRSQAPAWECLSRGLQPTYPAAYRREIAGTGDNRLF